MQRFYFDIELCDKLMIEDKEFFNQISFVLRSRLWDEIVLFNGDSYDYIYKVTWISKKWIELEQVSKTQNSSDPEIEITLYQAIPNKFEKIDYILQKWVEVGISNFVFYKSERCSKLAISDNKLERFNHIIKESLEQCGGNKLPWLIILDKLDLWKIIWKTLVCHTKQSENSKWKIENNWKKINIFVGPEWGFSDKEIEEFEKAGFWFINFWNRVLRTETMATVLVFKILN